MRLAVREAQIFKEIGSCPKIINFIDGFFSEEGKNYVLLTENSDDGDL